MILSYYDINCVIYHIKKYDHGFNCIYGKKKKATDFSCCTLGGMGVRMGVGGGGGGGFLS